MRFLWFHDFDTRMKQQNKREYKRLFRTGYGSIALTLNFSRFVVGDFLIRYEAVCTIRHRDLEACTSPGFSVLINGYSGYREDFPYQE